MFEKVNPAHPDKVADRIAGAIVDLAYRMSDNPHIAVEVLIGHGRCFIVIESDVTIYYDEIDRIVNRISGLRNPDIVWSEQDIHLNRNQDKLIRCGDNGIFKKTIITDEQRILTEISKLMYEKFGTDGKYLIDGKNVTICQSCADLKDITDLLQDYKYNLIINPLGEWTGGLDTDSGATNRKLGSDMGDGISGGGLHGKDLSKADVTLNICSYLDKRDYSCSIGDEYVAGVRYDEYVKRAKDYIDSIGGFEKFAEWGLIR